MFRPKPAIFGAIVGVVQVPLLVGYLSSRTDDAQQLAERLRLQTPGSSARSLPTKFRDWRERMADTYNWTMQQVRGLQGSSAVAGRDALVSEERGDVVASACTC